MEETGHEFYLAAAVVPERVHARLSSWVERYVEGRSRPLPFPEVVDGCPVELVAVRRSP